MHKKRKKKKKRRSKIRGIYLIRNVKHMHRKKNTVKEIYLDGNLNSKLPVHGFLTIQD